jgi:hypothetical protein
MTMDRKTGPLLFCASILVSIIAFAHAFSGFTDPRRNALAANVHLSSTERLQSRTTTSALCQAQPGGDFGELTSALATLDQRWQIEQQRPSDNGKPKWSKLVLPPREDDEETMEDQPGVDDEDDYVWMLEPPNQSIPSCVVIFTGGAGLGQFPQVAYNELLSEVSTRLNAICLTAPYEVGLDHFSLAKQTGEKLRRALLAVNEKRERETSTTGNLPAYSLAHSLGCKLQTIYLGATGLSSSFDGVGFLAYNNFSFAGTIKMARSFAKELRGGTNPGASNSMGNQELIDSIFDFAEMAVGAIGVEFSPTPEDTERLIKLRYDENLQAKTRVFVFESDNLDSSEGFRSACGMFAESNNESAACGPMVSNLGGGHLTPVYFRWEADDLASEAMGGFGDGFSQENIDMAKEAMGGFQSASFGDEVAFGSLVDEVCDWILGKPPASIPVISSSSSSSSSSNNN